MSSINFDNPWLLLIALPIALLLLLPFFLTVRKDNRNFHNVTSCILHLLIAVLVAFSAAGASVESVITETNVYVVADVSYSTRKNLDVIDGYIRRLEKNLPLNTQMGVVCFGATDSHVVHTRLGEKLSTISSAVEKIDDSATDVASALQYTGKIFKGGVIKRIVLITDAKQTNESDTGAIKRAVDSLRASNVYVDAIYLDSNLTAEQSEVQVSSVEYSSTAYQGRETQANVYIQSNVQTRTTVNVYCGDELVSSQPEDISVGVQSIPVPLQTEETGEFRYRITLSNTLADTSHYNDEQSFTQTVVSQPKTLFITGEPREDMKLLQEIYGGEYAEQVTVKYAQTGGTISRDIPYTVAGLCEYDEIVLSNVDIRNIPNYTMLVESLDTAVSLLGKSLIGIGNLMLQNATDESLLKLADMLPVKYGSPVSEQKLYTIVLDVSNSMSLSRFDLAKSAAKQIVDLLDDEDQVGVIKFHGEASALKTITDASNREEIKQLIDDVEDEHGTVIAGGMNGAAQQIQSWAESMPTQIFLITDGAVNDRADWTNANSIAADMYKKYGAKTSVIAINPENEVNVSQLALTHGKGQYFKVTDQESLDKVVLAEIGSTNNDAFVDNLKTGVEKEMRYDNVLKGITIPENTYVKGYIAGKAKLNATTVLTAQHRRFQGGGSSNPDDPTNSATVTVPIYSYWDYGNGKASSFTSSFTGSWMEDWKAKDIDGKFFKNVFLTNAPKERIDVPFVSTLTRQAGGASLEVRPAELKAGAEVAVSLISPDGERTEIMGVAFDSSVFRCSFALPSVGEYKTEITYTYKGSSYTTVKSINVPYLAEYDCFTIFESSPLIEALGANGTVSEDGNLEIVNDESEIGVRIIDLTMPMLIACVVLFAVDILIRKLKWADIRGLFRKVNKGDKV